MIDFNRPAIVGNELKYIQDAVAQGMLCGDGKYTKLCSEWMKKRFDVNQVFLRLPVHMHWRWRLFSVTFSRGMR